MRSSFLFTALLSLAACDAAPAPPADPRSVTVAATPAMPRAAIDAASAAIMREPKVMDFNYRPDAFVQWIAAVADDGSPRFGYAGHLCMLLDQNGVPRDGQRVRVTDIVAQREHGEDFNAASLGAVRCSDAGRLDDAPAVG